MEPASSGKLQASHLTLSGAGLKNKLQKGCLGKTQMNCFSLRCGRGQADYKSVRELAALGAYLGISSLIFRM